MVHFPFSLDHIQCPAIQFAVAGALAFPAMLFSPLVAQANEFGNCTGKLLAAGIDADSAALACAQALHPDQVASCVVDVTNTAEITPEATLAACSRDRQTRRSRRLLRFHLHQSRRSRSPGNPGQLPAQHSAYALFRLRYRAGGRIRSDSGSIPGNLQRRRVSPGGSGSHVYPVGLGQAG